MVTPALQLNATIIPSGVTQTFAMGTNIPTGALAVVFKAYFTSPATATYIQIAPHGGDITAHAVVGNLSVANGYLDGVGIVQVDASGQVDIKANGGACTVTLYTYGYVM
jgi:hypothetical protein